MQNEPSNDPFLYYTDEGLSSALFKQPAFPETEPSSYGSVAPRKRTPDDMRKSSPESLIPLDAPTQARRYVMPSATSRKEVPAFFNRMRTTAQLSDAEEDELVEELPASNATDQEKIEWKRRQNTLAARRSRKRKLMNVQRLEETVERLTKEREIWKTRALTLKQILQSHQIVCPEFRD